MLTEKRVIINVVRYVNVPSFASSNTHLLKIQTKNSKRSDERITSTAHKRT